MILHTYEENNKAATVCLQGKDYIVQKYIDNEFQHADIFNKEDKAEMAAEDWILNDEA